MLPSKVRAVAARKARSARDRQQLKRSPTATNDPVERPAQLSKMADGRPQLQGDDRTAHASHRNLRVGSLHRRQKAGLDEGRRAGKVPFRDHWEKKGLLPDAMRSQLQAKTQDLEEEPPPTGTIPPSSMLSILKAASIRQRTAGLASKTPLPMPDLGAAGSPEGDSASSSGLTPMATPSNQDVGTYNQGPMHRRTWTGDDLPFRGAKKRKVKQPSGSNVSPAAGGHMSALTVSGIDPLCPVPCILRP